MTLSNGFTRDVLLHFFLAQKNHFVGGAGIGKRSIGGRSRTRWRREENDAATEESQRDKKKE